MVDAPEREDAAMGLGTRLAEFKEGRRLARFRVRLREDGGQLSRWAIESANEPVRERLFSLRHTRERDRLDAYQTEVDILCHLPDDCLAVAERHMVQRSVKFSEEIREVVESTNADALVREAELRTRSVELLAASLFTEQGDEAAGMVDEIAVALEERAELTSRITQAADGEARKAFKFVHRAVSRERAVRIGVVTMLAALSWLVGETLGGNSLLVRLVVAAASFVVLDWALQEKLVLPYLRERRRRSMKKATAAIVDAFRRVDRQVSVLREHTPDET
jgi:hypothetical protein